MSNGSFANYRHYTGIARRSDRPGTERSELGVLVDSLTAVQSCRSFRETARAIFDQACQAIGATAGFIVVLDTVGREHEGYFVERLDQPEQVVHLSANAVRGLRQRAYQSAQVVWCNDYATSEWASILPPGHAQVDNVLFAPLLVDDRIVGLLALVNKNGGFSDHDGVLATAFGQLAGVARRLTHSMDQLQALVVALNERNQELAEALARNVELANTDPLTGLSNRRHLAEALSTRFSYARRHGQPLSLIMMDLDEFKSVNDRYGHEAGDEILAVFAARVSATLRREDLMARFGGDEFALLLPGLDLEHARLAAERLRRLTQELRFAQYPGQIQASFGVASLQDTETARSLMARADAALYLAKTGGRDRVAVHPGHPRAA